MTDELYFAHPSISNSRLGLLNEIEGGSVDRYKYGFDAEKNFYVSALRKGTQVHRALLEPDLFKLSNTTRPSGKAGDAIDHYIKNKDGLIGLPFGDADGDDVRLKDAFTKADYYGGSPSEKLVDKFKANVVDYYNSVTDQGIDEVYLTQVDYDSCTKAVESLKNNKEVMDLLNPYLLEGEHYSEYAILTSKDVIINTEDGYSVTKTMPIKCKIDHWSIDLKAKELTLNDVKTVGQGLHTFPGYYRTVRGERVFVMGSFHKRHYHRQMAMYLNMLITHVEQKYNISIDPMGKDWKISVNMLVVEMTGFYRSRVYPIDAVDLRDGAIEYSNLLHELAEHQMYQRL